MFDEPDQAVASTGVRARPRRPSRTVMMVGGAAVLAIVATGGWMLAARPSTGAASFFSSYNEARAAFDDLHCPDSSGSVAAVAAVGATAGDYLAACGPDGGKYLLGPAAVTGADLSSASADPADDDATPTDNFLASFSFNESGTAAFDAFTSRLYEQEIEGSGSGAFAVVVNSSIIAIPIVETPVDDGKISVSVIVGQAGASTQISLITGRSSAVAFRPVLAAG